MKISQNASTVASYKSYEQDNKKAVQKDGKEESANVRKQDADSVTLTSDKPAKSATYEKPQVAKKHEPDHATIEQLKAESEQAYQQLRKLVEELLLKQGYTFQQLLDGDVPEQIKIDLETQNEAAKLIADDGPLGAEAVSDRIVDFAKAITGGDPAKIELMRDAITQGFDEAKRMLGDYLPDVSIKTYDLVMEKLDKWAKGE
ncbi:hypothetical protein BHU72_10450 [Desulfuribacillus stibiiarsenatis]|uniref:DUF5610 domain-containing protein n=1 Tax=Desulfuribacillus stibiiarsenatis TaxID=1390249 RepID=A0A1E5L954_9FIRM|nr:hypothetical protein [Desulfuribacillus stibiiarsenatis]OEH86661.1 hypothetical protein BHU72_10450 [Desulfuribacillus stibiiarsenatis]